MKHNILLGTSFGDDESWRRDLDNELLSPELSQPIELAS